MCQIYLLFSHIVNSSLVSSGHRQSCIMHQVLLCMSCINTRPIVNMMPPGQVEDDDAGGENCVLTPWCITDLQKLGITVFPCPLWSLVRGMGSSRARSSHGSVGEIGRDEAEILKIQWYSYLRSENTDTLVIVRCEAGRVLDLVMLPWDKIRIMKI